MEKPEKTEALHAELKKNSICFLIYYITDLLCQHKIN